MSEKNQVPEESQSETPLGTNLDTTSVEVIEAELVCMHQSAAFDVTSAEVSAHESALALVNAKEVEMTNSAAGAIRAENVNVVGQAGIVMAESVNLENTYAGLVAGDQVRGERIETLILIGNHVEGDCPHRCRHTRRACCWYGRWSADRHHPADRAFGVWAQVISLSCSSSDFSRCLVG